eukprot:s4192_g1.t5
MSRASTLQEKFRIQLTGSARVRHLTLHSLNSSSQKGCRASRSFVGSLVEERHLQSRRLPPNTLASLSRRDHFRQVLCRAASKRGPLAGLVETGASFQYVRRGCVPRAQNGPIPHRARCPADFAAERWAEVQCSHDRCRLDVRVVCLLHRSPSLACEDTNAGRGAICCRWRFYSRAHLPRASVRLLAGLFPSHFSWRVADGRADAWLRWHKNCRAAVVRVHPMPEAVVFKAGLQRWSSPSCRCCNIGVLLQYFANRCVKSLALVSAHYFQAFGLVADHFRQIVPADV